jgi:hypothetical protein
MARSTDLEFVRLDVATAICVVFPPDLQVKCHVITPRFESSSNVDIKETRMVNTPG